MTYNGLIMRTTDVRVQAYFENSDNTALAAADSDRDAESRASSDMKEGRAQIRERGL